MLRALGPIYSNPSFPSRAEEGLFPFPPTPLSLPLASDLSTIQLRGRFFFGADEWGFGLQDSAILAPKK